MVKPPATYTPPGSAALRRGFGARLTYVSEKLLAEGAETRDFRMSITWYHARAEVPPDVLRDRSGVATYRVRRRPKIELRRQKFVLHLAMTLPIIEDDPLPSELYHYTDAGGLKGILEGKQLWATHAAYLNDSEEIIYGRDTILSEIKKLNKKRPSEIKDAWTNNSNWLLKLFGTTTLMAGLTAMIQQRTAALMDNFGPFVTCLSESRDQLSQWRGYGGGGGYAIRFDPAGLHESVVRLSTPLPQPLPGMGPNEVPIGARRFIKMEYDTDGQYEFLRQQLIDFIHRSVKYFEDYKDDSESKKAQATQLGQETMGWLHGLMMHLKNPGFAEEKEYRILTFFPPDFFSPTDTGLVPRVNIRFDPRCVKEIIIGPGRSMETRETSVRYFLNVHNTDYPGVEVTPSKTPFRGN